MDHRRIAEMNIPELYATGRLSPEDEEIFETHLLECRECREQVAWVDDFGSSVRTVAVEETARVAARAGLLVWLTRRPVLRGALTAALLALAALPAWLLAERSTLQAELAEARAAAARPAPAPQVATVPEGPDPALLKQDLDRLSEERSRLQAELAREREAHEKTAGQMAALTQPQANTAVFSLGIVRGATDELKVVLGSRPEFLVLSLDLPAAEYESYRAALFDARGRKVWQDDGLLPTLSDSLPVLVHSSFLKPGSYRISLEGIENGRAVPAGSVEFEAVKED